MWSRGRMKSHKLTIKSYDTSLYGEEVSLFFQAWFAPMSAEEGWFLCLESCLGEGDGF